MKPKTEEIVMQEMNWASNQSEMKLIEDQRTALSQRSLLQIEEQIKLERWFIEHNLPIPR